MKYRVSPAQSLFAKKHKPFRVKGQSSIGTALAKTNAVNYRFCIVSIVSETVQRMGEYLRQQLSSKMLCPVWNTSSSQAIIFTRY